jgi:hypothetical protein
VQHTEEQQQRGGGSFVFGKSDDTRARGRERERGRKQRVVAIEMTHSLPMNTVCVWASDSLREREILNSRYYSPLPTHCHRFFCGIDVIAFLCCRLWTKKSPLCTRAGRFDKKHENHSVRVHGKKSSLSPSLQARSVKKTSRAHFSYQRLSITLPPQVGAKLVLKRPRAYPKTMEGSESEKLFFVFLAHV